MPERSTVSGSVDEAPLLGDPGYGARISNVGERVARSQQPLLANVGSYSPQGLENSVETGAGDAKRCAQRLGRQIAICKPAVDHPTGAAQQCRVDRGLGFHQAILGGRETYGHKATCR